MHCPKQKIYNCILNIKVYALLHFKYRCRYDSKWRTAVIVSFYLGIVYMYYFKKSLISWSFMYKIQQKDTRQQARQGSQHIACACKKSTKRVVSKTKAKLSPTLTLYFTSHASPSFTCSIAVTLNTAGTPTIFFHAYISQALEA